MELRPPRKRKTKVEVRPAPKKKFAPKYPTAYKPREAERKKATAKAKKTRQYGPTSSGSTTYSKSKRTPRLTLTTVRHTDTKGKLRAQAAAWERTPATAPRRLPSKTRRAGAQTMKSGVNTDVGRGYTENSINQIAASSKAGMNKLDKNYSGKRAGYTVEQVRAKRIRAGAVAGVSKKQIKVAQSALHKSKAQRTPAQRKAMKAVRRGLDFT